MAQKWEHIHHPMCPVILDAVLLGKWFIKGGGGGGGWQVHDEAQELSLTWLSHCGQIKSVIPAPHCDPACVYVSHATACTLVKMDARNKSHLKNTTSGGIFAWSSTRGFWRYSCFPPTGAASRLHSLLCATLPPGQKHKHEGMGMHI